MLYYFDTSAVIKRYIQEAGSQWVSNLLENSEHWIAISQLTLVEGIAALSKRQRMGHLTRENFNRVQGWFLHYCQTECTLIPFNATLIEEAIELLKKYSLRAYDSIQLATALHLKSLPGREALIFVCADNGLCQVAQREGLQVKNPNETEGD